MNIKLNCICGEPLVLVSDPYNSNGEVRIVVDKCAKCLDKMSKDSYHEGLVRGSQLRILINGD